MGGALGFLILLFILGATIIAGILYYIGEFIYIIILIIICKYKKRTTKKEPITKEHYKTTQTDIDKIIEKYDSSQSSKTKIEHDYFISKKEEFYCERCFKRISEKEYELNECMCEDCFTDVNYYGEDF